jgi:hypothetical protein
VLVINAKLLAQGVVLSFLSTSALADCEVRMALFKEAKSACQGDTSYCSDVPLYREDAVRSCGQAAVSKAEGVKSPKGEGSNDPSSQQAKGPSEDNNKGITALNEDMTNPETELPRSCAYFTKPAYQPVRLNYHQQGEKLCYHDIAYVCESNGTGREWVPRGNCGYHGRELPEACRLEGTCE